jgi:AraC-like DNA-binding protein
MSPSLQFSSARSLAPRTPLGALLVYCSDAQLSRIRLGGGITRVVRIPQLQAILQSSQQPGALFLLCCRGTDLSLGRAVLPALAERGVPCVLWVDCGPTPARWACLAAGLGVADIIVDSKLQSQSRWVLITPTNFLRSPRIDLLEHWSASMISLPDGVVEAAVSMLGMESTSPSLGAWAAAAGLSRRSLDRHAVRAGFRSASAVSLAAKMARAWEVLAHGPRTVPEAAFAAGFGGPRAMVANFRRATTLPPRRAIKELSCAEFVGHIERFAVRGQAELTIT